MWKWFTQIPKHSNVGDNFFGIKSKTNNSKLSFILHTRDYPLRLLLTVIILIDMIVDRIGSNKKALKFQTRLNPDHFGREKKKQHPNVCDIQNKKKLLSICWFY